MPVRSQWMRRTADALLRPLAAGATGMRRLMVRREGAVAILFGLAAIPVIIGAGIALDAARAYMVKIRLGAALDAAALAVGSQTGTQTSAELTTTLKNYFFDNYCKNVPSGTTVTQCASTVTDAYNISVQAINPITGPVVTYTATATVPTTFMRLTGFLPGVSAINSITVTVKAQTTKFPGLEIAVVLDNTGSMLCGENEGSTSTCGGGEVTSDTDCTNTSDASRICTLRRAALDFITTLQNAITSPQSIYMSIVPFVTNVNVGDNSVYGGSNTGLCTGGTSCTDLATDPTSGDFTGLRGNILPVVPIIGNTTSGNTTISSVSVYSGQSGGYVSGTTAIQPGMYIYGHGIPAGATVRSVGSSSISISSSAQLTYSGNALAVGPLPSSTCSTCSNLSTAFTDPTTFTTTGSWTTSSRNVTVASASGVAVGMVVTSSSSGIPTSTATTVSSISGTTVTLSATPTRSQSNKPLVFSMAGSAASGSTTISSLEGTSTSLNSIVVGMPISGTGIPTNAYVTGITGSPPTSLTISAATTSTKTGDILTLTNLGATTTTGQNTINNVSFDNSSASLIPTVGQVIVGNGIPANTTITAVNGTAAQFASGTGSLTLSQNVTTPSNFSGVSGTCCNTTVDTFTPITYDSAYDSASPAGSSTTQNWGGCVIEPTSSDENLSGAGVLDSASVDPDTSEPASGTTWYPFYWVHDNTNAWPTIEAQDPSTEPLATEDNSFNTNDGPNQGCPVPILPLTDMTTAAGVSTLQNAINSMWPRSSGGTQVHVGAIWGWRVLSPNTPFALNNGHPLSYAEANSTGWKKIMVLMTDGTEEAFSPPNLTGTGELTDGKLDTTNPSTAINTLGSRLATICSNMANDGIIIYTIGLGSGGSSNTQLEACPANGGFFSSATTSNLDTIFQNIAASIVHLRLTE
jgi:Flp pilus assembly protein TadG